jgi:hypothetical protein
MPYRLLASSGRVALLEGKAPCETRPPDVGEGGDDFQTALAYQGAMAYVYVADRSTCPEPGDRCDWTRPPRFEEDVLPLARAFFEANASGHRIEGLEGTLELVLSREPRTVSESAAAFEVFDGERLVPIAEYLEANPMPHFLDFEARLEGLAEGPYGHRAGDILLISRLGESWPIEERYYFSHPYHSWHGSAEASDSAVPIVIIAPGRDGSALAALVAELVGSRAGSQLDIVAIILSLLESEP